MKPSSTWMLKTLSVRHFCVLQGVLMMALEHTNHQRDAWLYHERAPRFVILLDISMVELQEAIWNAFLDKMYQKMLHNSGTVAGI
jgi:hypothetical protein